MLAINKQRRKKPSCVNFSPLPGQEAGPEPNIRSTRSRLLSVDAKLARFGIFLNHTPFNLLFLRCIQVSLRLEGMRVFEDFLVVAGNPWRRSDLGLPSSVGICTIARG
jgi:hypothetical protein